MNNSRIFIICTASLLGACSSKQKNTAQPVAATHAAKAVVTENTVQLTDAQLKMTGITIGKASRGRMEQTLQVRGVTEVPPESRYTISFPMSGYLKTNKLIPGTQVAKGAVIATLEDARFIELQENYLTSKSRLEYTQADYLRQEELNKTKATSDKVYQQAKSDYHMLKVQVKALSEQLRLIGINPDQLNEQNISRTVSVHAPISGYVSKVNVNPGRYISPGDILFELTDASKLHLSLTVFEKDASGIRPGQQVICYTNGEPEKKLLAEVHLVNRSLDNDRSLEVHCDFKQHYPGLLPGAYLNAVIVQDQQEMPALPEDAVVRWQNQYYIFIEAGPNKFTMQPVSIGRASEGKVAISSPLPDSNIVQRNAYALLMLLKNSGDE